MLYNPGILTALEVMKAKQPETGEDKRVFISHEEAVVVATIETDSSGTPTLKQGTPLDTARHFHLLTRRIGGESDDPDGIDITLSAEPVAGATGAAVSIIATLDLASFSAQRALTTFKLPVGVATDFIDAGTGGGAPTATAYVASITGSTDLPKNSKFEVIALPTEWTEVACTTNATGPRNGPASLAIGCGYDQQAYVVRARGEVQNLTLSHKYRNGCLDLAALFGARVCVKVEAWKDGDVLTETWVYTGHFINGGPQRTEETGEVIATSEGPYERCALFYSR